MDRKYLVYPLGFIIAIVISSILLLTISVNPLTAYSALILGALGSSYNIGETFTKFVPILLCALAFTFASRGGFWNIGGEGQLHMGALAALLLALALGYLPSLISIPLILLGSFFAGMAYISIPLIMRAKLSINEIFTTMIMNFIAILLVSYMCLGPLRDPLSINPQTEVIPTSSWLPRILPPSRLHLGIIFPIGFALLLHLVTEKTTLGYKIRLSSYEKVAKYAGINVSRVMAITLLLGGGLAGIAGMGEVLGTHHLLIPGFSPGYGFTGIIIAILAKRNFLALVPTTLLFSVLLVGGESMQRGVHVPFGIIYIIQAVIVLSILLLEKAWER